MSATSKPGATRVERMKRDGGVGMGWLATRIKGGDTDPLRGAEQDVLDDLGAGVGVDPDLHGGAQPPVPNAGHGEDHSGLLGGGSNGRGDRVGWLGCRVRCGQTLDGWLFVVGFVDQDQAAERRQCDRDGVWSTHPADLL